ncbi:MAG TPA: DNA polymerase ligase N-terminal domain-containing protein [Candidatus Nanoarchaeia archaeon]|nr:DNA polymerase ligase N-terminal domain-containing protein [Candidatus Nanoarchaeia archaeon]
MVLEEYNKKRDFKKTSEPKGKIKKSIGKKFIYTIQKHRASHLHYDLRLEMNGVLKSWAIPKEPPMEKRIKRLAVMTEDHPIGYEKFHGEIPKGEYGAGKVEIWDKGTYELKTSNSKKIEVIIHGKKLKGNYVLVKTNYGKKPEKSWLFFKTS